MKRTVEGGGWVAASMVAAVLAGWPSGAESAEKPQADKPVTYSNQVVRILQKHCQACHRPGEVAPFSLLSYEKAKQWSETIREVVTEGRMPPWLADPKHGKFANDRSLTQQEIDTLLAWIDGGMAKGDDRELPEPLKFVEGWQIGAPDVVLTMSQEFTVPARGTVEYQYFTLPTNFTEDKWVQAVEVRAGNRKVVHHILMLIVPPGSRGEDGRLRPRNSDDEALGFFAAMAPGTMPSAFPAGFGKKVPKGAEIVFQVHYTPIGTAETDRSSVGIVFAKEPVHTEIRTRGVFNNSFVIPPGAPNYPVRAAYRFPQDSYVLDLLPHTHLRGKAFEYVAVFPDGKSKKLLSIPRYDFNWQLTYRLAEPLLMPKGSKLVCTAHYDNSAANKANPDAKKRVTWGDQTWDEMMIGFITTTRKDENLAGPGEKAF